MFYTYVNFKVVYYINDSNYISKIFNYNKSIKHNINKYPLLQISFWIILIFKGIFQI